MTDPVEKLPTGVPGLDLVLDGGLPRGRTTLVTGSAGSGKTVLAVQFLYEGAMAGEPGIMVTFEESADQIRSNFASLHWDLEALEAQGRWRFVDASPTDGGAEVVGEFDFDGLVGRIAHAIDETGSTRVSLDGLSGIFNEFADQATIRRELRRVADALRARGVTAVLTAERPEEDGAIARFGIEQFVADNVVILRNTLEFERIRRTVQVLKLRGTTHAKGQFPFTIDGETGITVLPLSSNRLRQPSGTDRLTSGNAALDQMTNGGFFRNSIILVSGATGTGKTLTTTGFLGTVREHGGRALLSAFEESRDQLFRNAAGWGVDFEAMEDEGLLRVVCLYPEELSLEEHLLAIRSQLDEFQPTHFALDSLSALERVATPRSFRQFTIGLTSWLKQRGISSMLTSTTPTLLGGESVTTAHISTLTDSIVLLRYVEILGTVRRGIAVLKMRGSAHEKEIRELSIGSDGMTIGPPFSNVSGILAGSPSQVPSSELDRLQEIIDDVSSE